MKVSCNILLEGGHCVTFCVKECIVKHCFKEGIVSLYALRRAFVSRRALCYICHKEGIMKQFALKRTLCNSLL